MGDELRSDIEQMIRVAARRAWRRDMQNITLAGLRMIFIIGVWEFARYYFAG